MVYIAMLFDASSWYCPYNFVEYRKCFSSHEVSIPSKLAFSCDILTYGFERWQSANKGLQRGSVIDHLSSIDGVEASRMEVVFDRISPSGVGAASWSLQINGC